MSDHQTPQDIRTALSELRQAMAEASSLAGIIADLQHNVDRLRAPLAEELRTVKATIARVLPLLEGPLTP
jgi:ABC-type transporter Mla subunit MlaD